MPWLSRLLLRNWTLKFAALGIAVLLWIAVRVEVPNRTDLTSVPVRVDVQDPGWALLDDPLPATVRVRISGPSGELIRIVGERPSVVIPLDEVTSADTVVTLQSQWLRIQERAGVAIEGIQPSTVRLALEPVERLSLPAAPRLRGSLPDRIALAQPPRVHPAEIRVTGARSRVTALDSVRLEAVDLGDVSGSGRVTVSVDTVETRGVTVQPSIVDVELRVEERIERVVSGIPVVLPEGLDVLGDELEMEPRTASVILRGARSVVERMDLRGFRVEVGVDGAGLPEPGDEAAYPLRLVGLPELLEARLQLDEVVIRRRGEEAP